MRSTTPSIGGHEETGFIETDGQRVRYRVRGDGPPLLMLNGIGAPLEFWRPLEAHLGDLQTITVDPPGVGYSSTPRCRFSMRQYAGVMDDLLTHLGLPSVNVLGLSLGGLIAQELARRSPQRVEKLVLASTTCGVGSVPVPPKTWAVIVSPMRFLSRRHYEQIAPILYGKEITEDPSLLHEHMAIRERCKPSLRGYYVQLVAASTWSSRLWLRKLEMPVLVITGSADRVVPVANGRMIASAVRDGRLEIIEGGSHVCLLQEAHVTSQLIRDFLQEVGPSASATAQSSIEAA
jgi:pimeloyl-ACP methyl ester carboxylesterase